MQRHVHMAFMTRKILLPPFSFYLLRWSHFMHLLWYRLTVPMRLWSLLLASSCSLSHSCLSFSPGKATPRRRIKPEDSVWLARVVDDSWDVPDMEWGEVGERENNEQTKRWQKREGEWGWARRGRVTARLMDGSVFVRAENRKLASDKHNILLLIFPAWLTWNPTLPSDSPVWKLLPIPGSIKMRKIPFTQHVSHKMDCARWVQVKHIYWLHEILWLSCVKQKAELFESLLLKPQKKRGRGTMKEYLTFKGLGIDP